MIRGSPGAAIAAAWKRFSRDTRQSLYMNHEAHDNHEGHDIRNKKYFVIFVIVAAFVVTSHCIEDLPRPQGEPM